MSATMFSDPTVTTSSTSSNGSGVQGDEQEEVIFNAALAMVDASNQTSTTQNGAITQEAENIDWEVDMEDYLMDLNNTALDDIVVQITGGTDSKGHTYSAATGDSLTQLNTKYNEASQQATQVTQQWTNAENTMNTEMSNRSNYIASFNSLASQLLNFLQFVSQSLM